MTGFRCCGGRCVVVGLSTQHCDGCHGDFRSTGAGDFHRIGSFDNPADPRRCRTADEMRAAGYRQDVHGRWFMPMPDKVLARLSAAS